MVFSGQNKPVDQTRPEHISVGEAQAGKKTESTLTYESVFDEIKEKTELENPQRWLGGYCFRHFAYAWRNLGFTRDEIFHEGVVAVYENADECGNNISLLSSRVRHHIDGFINEVLERDNPEGKRRLSPQSVDFQAAENDREHQTGQEIIDALKVEFQPGGEEEPVKSEIMAMFEEAERAIVEGEETPGQGQRDWEIFTRSLTGQDYDTIIQQCDWLSNTDSVRKVIERVKYNLRSNQELAEKYKGVFGAPEQPGFNRKEYSKKWYMDHAEEQRAKARERVKAWRERRKQEISPIKKRDLDDAAKLSEKIKAMPIKTVESERDGLLEALGEGYEKE